MTCLVLCYPYIYLALVIFDALLSLPLEIKCIWYQKLKLGSILYIMGRYATIIVSLIDMHLLLSDISFQMC